MEHLKRSRILAAFAVLLFVSCNQASTPSSAEAPIDGAIFTYHVTGDSSGRAISMDQSDTVLRTGDGFLIKRGAVSPDQFKLRDDGDIELSMCCDWLPFGIGSHGSYQTKEMSTPTKHDGYEFTGYLRFSSQYLGTERVVAAGNTYDCVKIKVDATIREEGGNGKGRSYTADIKTYWYASSNRYFVRVDEQAFVLDTMIFSTSRVLTSVR